MALLQKGFSLIELMVVVAIIGIIASIAYPSYQGYTCDTYRGQAVADLKLCALAMERHYSDGFTYVGATVTAAAGSTCKNQSPVEGVKKFDLATVTTANSYTLTATPATGHGCNVATFKTLTLTADGTLTES